LLGLCADQNNTKKNSTNLVKNESSSAEITSSAPVTNYNFNFTGDSSNINFGDFNFPDTAGNTKKSMFSNKYEHQASHATVDLNKPYGSFSSAHEPDIFIQDVATKEIN
jgi:hypothetical protein